jgi:D-xylose reductase
MSKENCANIIYESIKRGTRLLDGAEVYGNENEVGDGIHRALNDDLVKREDLFIVSKLWNQYHRPENVKPALLRSLKSMRVEYLDLYLVHFPIALKFVDP